MGGVQLKEASVRTGLKLSTTGSWHTVIFAVSVSPCLRASTWVMLLA